MIDGDIPNRKYIYTFSIIFSCLKILDSESAYNKYLWQGCKNKPAKTENLKRNHL